MPDPQESNDEVPRQDAMTEDTVPAGEETEPQLTVSPDLVLPDALLVDDDGPTALQDEEPETASVQELAGDVQSIDSLVIDDSKRVPIELPAETPEERNPLDVFADSEWISAPLTGPLDNEDTQPIAAASPTQGVTTEGATSHAPPIKQTTNRGGWRRRFRESARGSSENEDEVSPLSDSASSSAMDSNIKAIRGFFDPGFSGIDLRWTRRTVGFAIFLAIALLLANQAGAALMVASAVVPILVVLLLTAHDLYERESPLLLLGVGAAGAVAGIVLGSIASWIVGSQWFDEGHLNFGAGGFGGNFVDGTASFLVWLIVGLLLPAATVAGLASAPLLLRRWPQFANEVMDGMILAGTSAAGLAIGYSSTFWWPMSYGDGPLMDVSEWTLTIAGEVLLRPLVITLSGAMIGAGVWRYMLQPKGSITLVLPAASGVLGIMVLAIGSLATQPAGIWPEFLLTLVLAVVVFAAYRRTLDAAMKTDAAAMGADGERMICPHCHLITPVGGFCGRCGKPLEVVTHEEATGVG